MRAMPRVEQMLVGSGSVPRICPLSQLLRAKVVSTSLHGSPLSSVPSGDRSVNPATLWCFRAQGSPESVVQCLPGNIVALGSLHPPKRLLEQSVPLFPVGNPLQGIELATQSTPEVSFERLIPLVDYLAVWKHLTNVSQWVLLTVERGYRIQLGSPLP